MPEFAKPIEITPLGQLEFNVQVAKFNGWKTSMEVADSGEVKVDLEKGVDPKEVNNKTLDKMKRFVGITQDDGGLSEDFNVGIYIRKDSIRPIVRLTYTGVPTKESVYTLTRLEHYLTYPKEFAGARVRRAIRQLWPFNKG